AAWLPVRGAPTIRRPAPTARRANPTGRPRRCGRRRGLWDPGGTRRSLMVLSQRAVQRGVPLVVLALACVSACGGAGDASPRPVAPRAGQAANMLGPGEWASW